MPDQKIPALGDGLRKRVTVQRRNDLPESVLRVSVKEHHFSGFHRREAAENQNSGVLTVKRGNRMYDHGSDLLQE
jgi:hypothetical protein